MTIVALLLCASVQALLVRTTSPVEKVVELITELKAKIESDQAAEQKIYDKYACWCESTTKRKATAIDDGKATIGTTTTKILTLKGAIAVLSTEVADLEAKIADNNEAMAKLTKIREKENGDYQQEKSNMETALGSLHQAIQVLSGAGTGGDMGLLSVAAKVRSAVLSQKQLAVLNKEKAKVLKNFLESPADYYDQKAQAKASYSPASATVTGILKDMYDTFAANLEKANQEESNLQKGFEDLIEEKTSQNKLDRETATGKQAQQAEKSQQLAENEQKLENSQVQLAEDEKFFEEASGQCKRKSDSWAERGRLRTEEMDGITKALEILTSDEARATFSAATETRPQDTFGSDGVDVKSFVQLSAQSAPREKAYKQLSSISRKTKSMRLARLATAVRTASKGHFDEVVAAIDTMIGTLREEGAEDIKQRDWCIDERNKERNHQNDLEYEIKQLEAKVERAEAKKVGLESDVTRVTKDKADLIAAMDQALADREAENAAFGAAKDDDLKAIGLLEDAIAAMSAYSSNNEALLQVQKKHHKKKQPEFEVSKDQAPDAQLSGSDKHSGASKGIVSLLTQIKENLENEVKLGTASEGKATEEYDALKASGDAQNESYDLELTNLDAAIAATDAEILEDGNTKTDVDAQRTTTVEYLDSINPNCDWIEGAFEKRAESRKSESEGLEQAKATLSGAEGGSFGFMQRVH